LPMRIARAGIARPGAAGPCLRPALASPPGVRPRCGRSRATSSCLPASITRLRQSAVVADRLAQRPSPAHAGPLGRARRQPAAPRSARVSLLLLAQLALHALAILGHALRHARVLAAVPYVHAGLRNDCSLLSTSAGIRRSPGSKEAPASSASDTGGRPEILQRADGIARSRTSGIRGGASRLARSRAAWPRSRAARRPIRSSSSRPSSRSRG
jgi:hypothetical protein